MHKKRDKQALHTYLYGSARAGEHTLNRASNTDRHYYRVKGNRHYELTNHLGNVLAVVTDRKIAKDTTADATYTPQFFMPDVYAVQNYYAFGQSMPKWSTTATVNDPTRYRYGMNGQEKDIEIPGAGNTYTAEFWEYDARTGRRWNLDPKPIEGISLYAAFGNNPIIFNDVFGDTIRISGDNGIITNWLPGVDYQGDDKFTKETIKALESLYQNKNAGEVTTTQKKGNIFDFVTDAEKHVTIENFWNQDGTARNSIARFSSIDYTTEDGQKIFFDPYTGILLGDLDDTYKPMYPHHKKGTVIVPAVLLAHELVHAWFTQYNSEQKAKWREIGAKTKWNQDIEHEKYIHGMSGVESNFSMAMHGTIRAYRIPKEKPDLRACRKI